MARLTDHDVRDAEHALRMELALIWGRYSRRMQEAGKAAIQTEIEEANKRKGDVDGTAIGRAAAERAAREYFTEYFNGLEKAPYPVIESGADPADGFA